MFTKFKKSILYLFSLIARKEAFIQNSDFIELKNPLKFNYVNEYFLKFVKWLEDMQIIINQEFSNYKTKEKINEAIIYINDHYANDLNMAVVSNFISMNYSLFSLNFKEFAGMNFVNYLKNIRIEKAKELLAENDSKIHEISQSVGYSNEKHFMKVFKSITGVSPSEYRKNMRISKK